MRLVLFLHGSSKHFLSFYLLYLSFFAKNHEEALLNIFKKINKKIFEQIVKIMSYQIIELQLKTSVMEGNLNFRGKYLMEYKLT